jgi:5-methylcytosine-specific restriction endonuclease McrA
MKDHEFEQQVADLIDALKSIEISQSQLDDLRLLYENPMGFQYQLDKKNAPQGPTLDASRRVGSNIKKALGIVSALPFGMRLVGYGDEKTSTWRMNPTFRAALDRLNWFPTGDAKVATQRKSGGTQTGFEAWLIQNGSSEKTASNYAGAIAGRLKDLALIVATQSFSLSQIDSKEAFNDFCGNVDGSGEIKALNARGKDMYRRALVWYAKFLALQVTPTSIEAMEKRLMDRVTKALGDTPSARAKRLATASKVAKSISVSSVVYERNPDVVAQVLFEAKGSCQGCGNSAPFIRRSDLTPYLEVHHRIPLANGGEDSVANAIALCPNCHRKAHYGV